MHGDDFVHQARMGRVRKDRVAGVKGNRAERIEFILHVAVRLGVFYVRQIHGVEPERAKAAVADLAAIFDALGNGKRAVISGPGGLVSGEAVFFVFFFLA
jgi:hypothetical protein